MYVFEFSKCFIIWPAVFIINLVALYNTVTYIELHVTGQAIN